MHTVSLEEIGISGTNTRAKEHPADLAELVESIKQHGILQPVVVRDMPEQPPGEHPAYELVCGHRRLEAAKLAGLEDIPVVVHTLTDEQALEFQITENLQRADLHPLDEAMGFQQLVDRGHDAAAVAVKVGKSRGYVYQRLSFLKLPTAAQKLFRAGAMNASLALLVARIPDEKLQELAAKKILEGNSGGYDDDYKPVYVPLTLAQATEMVQREYMQDMKSAPFDILNADLVPAAGPCSSCPKRTGNAVDLFGDVGKQDMCTDPACFAGKAEASWVAACAPQVVKGARALTIEQSAALFANSGGDVRYNAKHVKPGACPDSGGKKSWETLAAAAKVEPRTWLARHPKTAKPIVVWQRSEIERLLAKKKASTPATTASSDDEGGSGLSAHSKRDSAARATVRIVNERYGKLIDTALFAAVAAIDYRDFTEAMVRSGSGEWDSDRRFEALGLTRPTGPKAWASFFNDTGDGVLRGLLVSMYLNASDDDMKLFGVVPAEVMKRAKAEIAAEQKAAAKIAAETAAAPPQAAAAKAKPAAKKGGKK